MAFQIDVSILRVPKSSFINCPRGEIFIPNNSQERIKIAKILTETVEYVLTNTTANFGNSGLLTITN